MFGMGMSEILVILLVAALFLGPDKLPDAATKISKGIRDLRRQTRDLQDTIENDTEIGGAIRDLKSALRGDEIRRPPVRKIPSADAVASAVATAAAAEQAALPGAPPGAPPGEQHELVTDPPAEAAAVVAAEPVAASADDAAPAADAVPPSPAVTLPATAGQPDSEGPEADDAAALAALVRPAAGTIKRDPHGPL